MPARRHKAQLDTSCVGFPALQCEKLSPTLEDQMALPDSDPWRCTVLSSDIPVSSGRGGRGAEQGRHVLRPASDGSAQGFGPAPAGARCATPRLSGRSDASHRDSPAKSCRTVGDECKRLRLECSLLRLGSRRPLPRTSMSRLSI